jgi:hypothetical protein
LLLQKIQLLEVDEMTITITSTLEPNQLQYQVMVEEQAEAPKVKPAQKVSKVHQVLKVLLGNQVEPVAMVVMERKVLSVIQVKLL